MDRANNAKSVRKTYQQTLGFLQHMRLTHQDYTEHAKNVYLRLVTGVSVNAVRSIDAQTNYNLGKES